MLDNVLALLEGPLWARFKIVCAGCLLLSLLGLAIGSPGTNILIEGAIFDLMLAHKAEWRGETRDDLVIVAIDDLTLSNPHKYFPQSFNPTVWGTLLESLVLGGAKAVAVHQPLPAMETHPFSLEDESRWFRAVQSAHKNSIPVLFGFRYLSDRPLFPSAKYLEIMGREWMGFLNLVHDRDNKVRLQALKWPEFTEPDDPYSFSVTVAASVDPTLTALPGEGFYIDYSADIPKLSFSDIYDRALNGEMDFFKRIFADKIVFIGDTSSINMDAYPTPASDYLGQGGQGWNLMSAVEIQAHSVATLLSGNFLQEPHWFQLFVLYFGLTFLALSPIIISVKRDAPVAGWLPTAVAVAYPFLCYLAFRRSVYFPVVAGLSILILADVLYWAYRTRESRVMQRTSNQALTLYLNPDLAGQIMHNPDYLERRGELRDVTVFFADLVGFTSMSENMDTGALVDILNRYYDTMNTAIERFGGFVDKFVGDAIMAVWGAPSSQPKHAISACLSALMQKRLMDDLNRDLTAANLPFLQALMGINTGQVIAGNIGAKHRINYTVMGDAVNLASRLVSVNKLFLTTIIASEDTRAEAQSEICFRALDKIRVKGRKGSLTIYEVLAPKGELSNDMAQCVNYYERALKHYFDRDFKGALARFEAALKCNPNDNPSLIFSRRCMDFIASPPDAQWDGVTVLEAK
ncbi:MAG: adenylate/guanylate cyclase domain-containing protein [Deltaproteobacteria bacterium]|jgi:class 3 adenylate cyclase/CHASE2 domain-containing sensor protein|nr:adenylate/guanylate cyclase domain-containing protein [Deltaproteobacteria bacterium]